MLEESPAPPSPEHVAGALQALPDIARGAFGNEDERVLLLSFGPRNLPSLYGVDSVGGYNPLVQLQYLDFVSLVNHGHVRPRAPLDDFAHGALPIRPETTLFDAASIRFLISPGPIARPGLRLVRRYERHPLQRATPLLYENVNSLPRAYLAFRATRAIDHGELQELLGEGFDGRRSTVVEGDAPRLDGPPGILPVEVVRERPEVLRFDVAADHPALLVVTDSWYPGWRAWVDGDSAPVLRVNALFRGVPIPAGAHRVDMRFEPRTFRVGATLSVAAALAIAALLAVGLRRRGRAMT